MEKMDYGLNVGNVQASDVRVHDEVKNTMLMDYNHNGVFTKRSKRDTDSSTASRCVEVQLFELPTAYSHTGMKKPSLQRVADQRDNTEGVSSIGAEGTCRCGVGIQLLVVTEGKR